MSKCIAYFSKDGNTENLVKAFAKTNDVNMIELHDDVSYKGIFGFIKGGFRSTFKISCFLPEKTYNKIEEYDEIYLATPVWAGSATPAINAVLKNVDFTGKKVYIMTTQADEKFGGEDKRIAFYSKIITEKDGKLEKVYSFQGASMKDGPLSVDEFEKKIKRVIK